MQQYFLLALVFLYSIVVSAQDLVNDSIGRDVQKNAFEKISKRNHLSEGTVHFYQDARIEKIVIENSTTLNTEVQGYRVQVFSSNAHRTAKDEAFKLEQRLSQVFPDHKVYVTYSSPFWKVRMGDFYTQEAARTFMDELLGTFPSLRKETYTVRDRITVTEK